MINKAENKIAEYESRELGKKITEKAVEELKEEEYAARKRKRGSQEGEKRKKAYEDLKDLLKSLRKKGL